MQLRGDLVKGRISIHDEVHKNGRLAAKRYAVLLLLVHHNGQHVPRGGLQLTIAPIVTVVKKGERRSGVICQKVRSVLARKAVRGQQPTISRRLSR